MARVNCKKVFEEKKMIQQNIKKLVKYGLLTGLIEKEDEIYTTNRLLEFFQLDDLEESDTDVTMREEELETVLGEMLDYAYEKGLMAENGVVYRDLFDTKIMGLLTPRPSEVIRTFREKYARDPKEATDYFYKLSQDTDYIRRYRIKKDQKWVSATQYGDLDITINLSKPEKDPKAIAAAKMPNRAVIRNVFSAGKTRGMRAGSIIRRDRITGSSPSP